MSNNCSRCNGSGQIHCPGCGGRGSKTLNEGLNKSRIVNCAGCTGSGKVTCGSCGGGGGK